jgi:phosphoribosylanthranilate isomerase
MIIKVCGMRDPENIREVAAIRRIDLIGLIFYANSPRFVDSAETAYAITDIRKSGIVGVFVNEVPEIIVRKCAEYHLDYIQLHGNESPEYLNNIIKLLNGRVKIIKAFSIRAQEDLQPVSGYEDLCEYFLFDTPTTGYGGSGRSFDWKILQYYSGSTPFLLSGGIGPDSIEALGNFHHNMWEGLDLNSRFETAPGMKDIALISRFVHQLKSLKS